MEGIGENAPQEEEKKEIGGVGWRKRERNIHQTEAYELYSKRYIKNRFLKEAYLVSFLDSCYTENRYFLTKEA